MFGRSVGQRILSDGPGLVFHDELAAMLRAASIAVGNLECSVSERGEPQAKGYTFRAPLLSAESLKLAGFDVVSLANNHSLDYGPTALADTRAALAEHGIQPVGGGKDIAEARSPAFLDRGGVRIAFVGLVDAPAEGDFSRAAWEAQPDRPGVAWADRETVASAVREAVRSADVVVALLHFGIEYQTRPSVSQRELAHAAIDAGATIVLGSHPHVLQEVEEYGSGLIAYSLGNFVFDGFDGAANVSAVLRMVLTSSGVSSWELVPVLIGADGLPRLLAP